MTEPDVASSDDTKLSIRIERDGDKYVINGRKLFGNVKWNDGVKLYILIGCSDSTNPNSWKRHSTVLVPADTPGLRIQRNLTIMVSMCTTTSGFSNVILWPGRAFEMAQGRLEPGRLHHCMRLISQCEHAYEFALIHAKDKRKQPRGRLIGEFDSNIGQIAQMRLELDALRLIVLNAAHLMDVLDNKAGKYVIAHSKVLVPYKAAQIIIECMQMYGGQSLTQHTPMPEMWTYARFVRLADGPDAAHRHQVGRDQLKGVDGLGK